MKNVLLINEKQLKDESLIETNVDSKVLSKVILNAQQLHLQPILGTSKYEEVLSAVYEQATNGTELSDNISKLLKEFIKPFLIHAAIIDFIVFNNYKLTNKGILKMTDASSQSIVNNELEYIKNYYDNYMAVYKNRLIEYLKDTEQDATDADTDVSSYSIGWYLEN